METLDTLAAEIIELFESHYLMYDEVLALLDKIKKEYGKAK